MEREKREGRGEGWSIILYSEMESAKVPLPVVHEADIKLESERERGSVVWLAG